MSVQVLVSASEWSTTLTLLLPEYLYYSNTFFYVGVVRLWCMRMRAL